MVDWVAGTGRAAAVCATGVAIRREQWWDSRPQFSHAPRQTCTREPKRAPTGCRFWSPPVIVSGPRRCTPRQYRSTRVYRSHRRHFTLVRVFSLLCHPSVFPAFDSFVCGFLDFSPRDRHRQTSSFVVRHAINSLERLYSLRFRRRRRHERFEQSKSKHSPNILHTYVRILVVLFSRNEHSSNRTFHRYCHCRKKQVSDLAED